MRIRTSFYTLLVAVIFAGCVQTTATMLSSKNYPELTPEEVTIYLEESDIPAEFEKLALLNATGSTAHTNEQQMYEAMKKRAAKIGANGILFQPIDEPGQGAKIAGALLGTGTNRKAEMVAIYVHK